jgi:hypothetical protein
MVLPPTWSNVPALPFEHLYADSAIVPTVAHTLDVLLKTPTAISVSSPAPRYIAFESAAEGRRASVERLQNKVVEIKINPLPDSDDLEREQIRLAAEITAKLISEIPNNLPLPKVMPLSSQISLYWEFGETYAELAVSGNGQLSIYGRKQGRSDILVDTTFAKLRASGLSFPNDFDKILIVS